MMEVYGGLTRGVVGFVEAELLVAGLVRPITQQVDRSIAPTPLELIQVEAQEIEGVDLLRDRPINRTSGLCRDPRQSEQVGSGVAGIVVRPGDAILAIQPIHLAG